MPGKFRFWGRLIFLFTVHYFGVCGAVKAQSGNQNKYGLYIIDDVRSFQETVEGHSDKQMLNVRKSLPGATLDLRYATPNNFMHQQLYPPIHTTYLRRLAVAALQKVMEELKKQNLSIKIFDAYRPYSVTEKMWEIVKDDRYAADPSKGSGHNRGAAVDLTLVDIVTKVELPMGTGFDNFSDTAHNNFTALPAAVLNNRAILKSVMEKYGFINLATEWWHFSLPDASAFDLLDLSFDKLKKITKRKKKIIFNLLTPFLVFQQTT
ncbi:MAG: M15 family metallopeptidase [Ginsengibacter sp.]